MGLFRNRSYTRDDLGRNVLGLVRVAREHSSEA